MLFSEQENMTVVRWRISSTAPGDTQFELVGPDGYRPIQFSASVFPGGIQPCVSEPGSCAQLVLRGSYAYGADPHPIRAVHPVYGVLPGAPAKQTTAAETFAMDSFFRPHNDRVYVNIEDRVANDGPYVFSRPYERAMWATSGLCVLDSAPDGVGFSPLDETGGFAPATPLTDAGMYCVGTRPVASDGGAVVMAQTRIATVPEVERHHHRYRPAVERSPITYQLVLDLEIPVADRCAEALRAIESEVDRNFVGAPVHKLPTINLAGGNLTGGPAGSGCAQVDDRVLDAAPLAQAVKQIAVAQSEAHQQFHLLYFNNLDAPLPNKLSDSLRALFMALAPPPGIDLVTLAWLFNPGAGAIPDLGWWRLTPWITADDPAFVRALVEYASSTLPYQSQFHDPAIPVRFVDDADATTHDGDLIKICSSSPNVEPLSSTNPLELPFGPSWTIHAADPPAYFVALPFQTAAPASSFVEVGVEMDYQICTRYCVDHPYINSAGDGVKSWAESFSCTSKDYD